MIRQERHTKANLFGNQHGTAWILTLTLLLSLVAVGGLAIDTMHIVAVRNELQKAMDAAALAGAGNLGFSASDFPAARQAAQTFGALNPWSGGPISLNLNAGNTTNGNIVLGVFDTTNQSFTPSVDGTVVNAVQCRFSTPVSTFFMGLVGFPSTTVSADAIAISNPPATPPPDACLFPIGVGSCPFQGNTSLGCGAPITFISSCGNGGAGCLAPPCTNTAAWVTLDPSSSPNTPYLKSAINGAASGTCPLSPLQTGDSITANNGMDQTVMDTLQTAFLQQWSTSGDNEVKDASNQVVYSGKGWKVYIPVIQTACPAGAISGSHTIIGWTQFVITQVINNGDCAVANHWPGNAWDAVGTKPNCSGTNIPKNAGSLRAIFGYYNCTLFPANPAPGPLPRSALGTRLRLVK